MPKNKATVKKTVKKSKAKKTSKKTRANSSVVEVIEPEVIETHFNTEAQNYDSDSHSGSLKTHGASRAPSLKETKYHPQNSIEKVQSGDDVLVSDALTQYLAKIRNYPVLSKEQEHKLAVQYYETGDRAAAETLVKSNLKFVVKIAMEYSKFGAKLIDIIQEGNVGLMHALKEYNPYKGVKLISYAVWWIRGYIQDYLMKQQSLVKIGTNQKERKLFYQLEKEHAKILQEGLESTPLLLSQRLDVNEKDVLQMQQRLTQKDLSLDQTIGDDNDTNWLERQTDEESEAMDEMIIHAEQLELLKEKIEELKKDLNDKEIQLLEQRILSDNPVTLKSLGDEWNVTREAARQTEARLIEKIKKAFLT